MKDIKWKLTRYAFEWKDSSKQPILATILFAYIATLLFRDGAVLTKESLSGISIVLFLFATLMVYRERIFKSQQWLYFIIQGLMIFDCAVIMRQGFQAIYMVLIPVLIYESMLVYEEKSYVLLVAFLSYSLFSIILFLLEGVHGIVKYLPILGFVAFMEWVVYSMFRKQLELRVTAQRMTIELEQANMKLEDLAVEKERERVARDLHDTLSQGLSALVLQMEAIRANLDVNKTERAEEILSSATDHARKTLAESRAVLQKLREHNQEKLELRQVVLVELERFQEVFEGELTVDAEVDLRYEKQWIRQISYVVRECLNNIVKHAKADHVAVLLRCDEHWLWIKITDDGVGFNPHETRGKAGHFGLMGMEERLRGMGGEVTISSRRKKGTIIEIQVPISEEGSL